jgi:hypothetical protein
VRTIAQRISDLLRATLLAALTQEFDETTVDSVEEGKQSIALGGCPRKPQMSSR